MLVSPLRNRRFCCTTVLILQHFFLEEMKEEENNSDQKKKMENIVANSRKTTSPLHPGLSAHSLLPTPPGPGSSSPPPHFIFSLLFYFFRRRAIEINPSKKRKSANKMMKRHWQRSKGRRESVGVNAGMMKRASLPFGNRTVLINSPV